MRAAELRFLNLWQAGRFPLIERKEVEKILFVARFLDAFVWRGVFIDLRPEVE